jgi:hypothetical protein
MYIHILFLFNIDKGYRKNDFSKAIHHHFKIQ